MHKEGGKSFAANKMRLLIKISYRQNRYATYAAPTADHFLPLLYIFGASRNEKPLVFNNVCTLDAIAMTSFAFGM